MKILIRILLLALVLLCLHSNSAGAAFELSGEVSPNPAPFGEAIAFSVTVTNTGSEPDTFGVDGCPVHYVLDGGFRPQWGCAEFYRMIVLAPGESITFSPESEAPQLLHEPSLYPLVPGPHKVAFEIWGVGRALSEFEVLPVQGETAAVLGRVIRPTGDPAWNVEVTLVHDHADSVDNGEAGGPPPTREFFSTRTGDAGYFLLAGLPPRSYRLRAAAEAGHVWYPGVPTPDQAEVLLLAPGEVRPLRPLRLDPIMPPPPPPGARLSGHVFRETGPRPDDPPALPVPVENAMVTAVRLALDFVDSSGVDPGDIDAGGGILPPEGALFTTSTDDLGRFELELPYGIYKVVAGKYAEVLYRYWGNAPLIEDGEIVALTPSGPVPFMDFILPTRVLRAEASVRGTALAYDPTHDGPPAPLAGVSITAWPVLNDGPERIFGTVTAEDGTYELVLPPTTPWLIEARAEGYRVQYEYRHGLPFEANWADVAPGAVTPGVDFLLQPQGDPGGTAAIVGRVFKTDPLVDCLPGTDCVVPAAGALVRITPAYPTFAPWERTAVTGRDGSFAVRGIPADEEGLLSYYVSASIDGIEPRFHPGGVPFPDAEPLVVYAGGVADVGRIVLPVPIGGDTGFLGGIVLDPEGMPVAGAVVLGYSDPENPRGPVHPARTDARGTFMIDGLPRDSGVVVSIEAEGFIPVYYPDAHLWRFADRVRPAGPNVRMAPLEITLQPADAGGPFLQAGRVRALVEPGPDGDFEPASALLKPERRLALQYHRQNIPGAFFYLEDTISAGPMPRIVSGGAAGSNGAVILTGLHAGAYFAYADRPGYEHAYFGEGPDVGATPLILNEMTPAILADIRLRPVSGVVGPPGDGQRMVTGVLNEPNPFRPQTVIRYRLSESRPVTVQVFDYQGRLVRTLVDVAMQEAGPHQVTWDATDDSGRRAVSGVYFYRIQAGPEAMSRKMVLLP